MGYFLHMPLTPTARRRDLLTGLALAVLAWLLVMGTEWLRWRSVSKMKVPVQVQSPKGR